MKESAFIHQNKENWKHYEDVLQGKSTEPDELNDLFIHVTDDLSYSRSFYPNRSVRVYLNMLAQKVFLKIYSNRKRKQSFIVKFFKDELPAIMYTSRKEMLVCFLVFIITFMVGVFSSRQDAGFARQILGDRYINMTNANIKEGKPMNVYAGDDRLNSFFGIALNNLRVDMITFVTGLIFAIGTLFVLAYNGVMVGVFQYFFYGTGYFAVTVFTIWLHGTLEIFTMILSATAGLVFGKGLIVPGTYSRSQAFRISAVKGVKIFLAVIPFTLIAAFIEVYVTGYTDAPMVLKGCFIGASLLFILFYFVWLPHRRYSKTGIKVEENELPYTPSHDLILNDIKTVGEIISDTFGIWRKYLKFNTLMALVISAVLVLIVYFTEDRHLDYSFFGVPNNFFSILKLLQLNAWFTEGYYAIWPGLLLLFSGVFTLVHYRFFVKSRYVDLPKSQKATRFILSWLILSSVLTFFYYSSGIWWFLFYFFIAFPLSLSITTHILDHGPKEMNKGLSYYFTSLPEGFVLNLTLFLLLFIMYLVVTSPILNFLLEAVSNGLKLSDKVTYEIQKLVIITIGLTTLISIIPLYIFGHTIHFYSVKEKVSALSLRSNLEKIWS